MRLPGTNPTHAQFRRSLLPWRAIYLLSVLVVIRAIFAIASNYPDYLPPNFRSDFLLGRGDYFWNGYHLAFYVHIAAGPISLALGLLLMNKSMRSKYPILHRRLGRIQAINVLALLAPSGLWMSYYSATGMVASSSFATLSLATAATVALGWRAAINRRFSDHELWMTRCFVLLCSAVVLRIIGGLFFITDVTAEWTYPLGAWLSWIGPLAMFELVRRIRKRQESSYYRMRGNATVTD